MNLQMLIAGAVCIVIAVIVGALIDKAEASRQETPLMELPILGGCEGSHTDTPCPSPGKYLKNGMVLCAAHAHETGVKS